MYKRASEKERKGNTDSRERREADVLGAEAKSRRISSSQKKRAQFDQCLQCTPCIGVDSLQSTLCHKYMCIHITAEFDKGFQCVHILNFLLSRRKLCVLQY